MCNKSLLCKPSTSVCNKFSMYFHFLNPKQHLKRSLKQATSVRDRAGGAGATAALDSLPGLSLKLEAELSIAMGQWTRASACCHRMMGRKLAEAPADLEGQDVASAPSFASSASQPDGLNGSQPGGVNAQPLDLTFVMPTHSAVAGEDGGIDWEEPLREAVRRAPRHRDVTKFSGEQVEGHRMLLKLADEALKKGVQEVAAAALQPLLEQPQVNQGRIMIAITKRIFFTNSTAPAYLCDYESEALVGCPMKSGRLQMFYYDCHCGATAKAIKHG